MKLKQPEIFRKLVNWVLLKNRFFLSISKGMQNIAQGFLLEYIYTT